jgi:HSP20 family protein
MAQQTLAPEKKTNGAMRHWDPADLFQVLHQEMERFWPRFGAFPVATPMPAPTAQGGISYMPRMDAYDKDNTLVLKAELPGLKKEDVRVEIEDGYLVIRGESKAEQEVKEDAYYRMERNFGSFYRSIALPYEVKPEQIKATLNDGVLEVQIPKPAEAKPQATTIPVA